MTGTNISEDSTHNANVYKTFAQRYATIRSKSNDRNRSYAGSRFIIGSVAVVERLWSIYDSILGVNRKSSTP